MVKTINKCHYHLRYGCDKDAIGFEAQANGCELFTGKGEAVITMWETNPYNSLFVLKYNKDIRVIKQESWIL